VTQKLGDVRRRGAVGRELRDQALAGDTAAPKVLFARVVGRLRRPPPTAPTSTNCGC
jgi:hypothetical protein